MSFRGYNASINETEMKLLETIKTHLFITTALSLVLYGFVLVTYRLYFSPLSHFPGSRIAAATGWYEFYYDIIKDGSYLYKIEEMHDKYGPIIRVSPWELVIRDPEFYRSIYVSAATRRTNSYWRHRVDIGFNDTFVSTTDHDLHRMRRKPLEPFFSRQNIFRLEPGLADHCRLLAQRFESLKGTSTVVCMEDVYSAFTADIVGKICFDKSLDLLSDPNFSPDWSTLVRMTVRGFPIMQNFQILARLAKWIPYSIVGYLLPGTSGFSKLIMLGSHYIEQEKKNLELHHNGEVNIKRTMVQQLLSSDIPEAEKSTERIGTEISSLLGAASAPPTRTLCVLTYYILSNPGIEHQVRQELQSVMAEFPNKMPSLTELEQLPYLQALIKEGLRCSMPVIKRLLRLAPDVPIQYKEWTIPVNTPVGMSVYPMLMDANVYPNPSHFEPERWLGDYNPLMDRNFVPFSKGSRGCIGSHLSKAELCFILAVLFRPGGPKLSLHDTSEEDVLPARDETLAIPKTDKKAPCVIVH